MDFECRSRNDAWIYRTLSLGPDLLIALAFMKLMDDRWDSFGWALAFLFIVYLLIGLKTVIWSTVVWRLWARKRNVE